MPPVGFELTISAGERPQTYALNRAAIGTGSGGALSIEKYGKNTVYITRVCARYLYKKSLLLATHVFRNNSCVLGQ
jgi:hypothetical protein